MIKQILLVIIIYSSLFSQFNLYNHPELEWKTIETEHFKIHFHKGTERSARETAEIAEHIYPHLTDLYDYITKGSLDGDIRLMNSDIIFIPVRNNSIEITGAVNKPSIFEIKENEGLLNLIDFAGGLNVNASIDNVLINRIKPFDKRNKNEIFEDVFSSSDPIDNNDPIIK